MSNMKKMWTGIGIFILLTPLGLLVPKWLGVRGAWGEWDSEEIEKIVGYVPEGMKRLAQIWKAPLPDYTLPGQNKGLVFESFGYMISAVIGIALTAGVMYVIAKFLIRRSGKG